MTVKCEAMVDGEFTPQSTERNEAPKGDDLSGKTIEFLRARLLAERAASRSARQQAQEIAEKVKDLHARLEMEIGLRKEAEAAVRKVLSVLKAKGVAVDDANLMASKDLTGQPMGEVPPSNAYVEATKAPCSLDTRNANIQKGIVECTSKDGTTNLHQDLLVVDNTCSASDGVDTNPVSQNGDVPSRIFMEHQHWPMDKVQEAELEENLVCPDHNESTHCTPILKKDDVGTGQCSQQGLHFTLRLKAMLQQIEEEVGALPEEQPLRDKLKGWVDHAATMLGERGAASNEGMEIHQSTNNTRPHVDCLSEGGTTLETKTVIHTQMAADVIYVNDIGGNPVNHNTQEVDRRSGLVKSLFPAPQAQPQQRNLTPSTSNPNAPPSEVKLLNNNKSQQRIPPCESLNGGNRAACVAQCPSPQLIQYENPHSKMASPSTVNCSYFSRGNNHMGQESSYLVEVPSPKSSDALSVGEKMGYTHRQHHESPARATEVEDQNAWSPARLQSQPRAMLSKGYFKDELSNELLRQLEIGYPRQNIHFQGGHSFSPRSSHTRQTGEYTRQNIHFQGGHSFSRSTHTRQTGDYNRCMGMKQPKDSFPSDGAARSVMDDRNGRLGCILMALDAARHHIEDDEFLGPPTQTLADARLKRGYGYVDHCVQQLPPKFEHDQTWRCRAQSSHTPIIQFPPSPTSEHGYGYSPFDKPRGAHRRSSSVSTNFMMSEWDNYLQPRGGEVHLGNGITLFTD